MRLATFLSGDKNLKTGALVGDRVIDLAATDSSLPTSMRGLLAGGADALAAAARAAASPKAVAIANPALRAPVPDPQKVICVGLNYRDHAAESGAKIPSEPVIFSKFSSAVIGPEEPIRLPKVSSQVDYEAELVVVIGRRGKNIARDRALDYVAGYTCGHDVSARDWQLQKDGKQWLLGKTFDTFAPIGPAIVTKDEIADPGRLPIRFRLNGAVMQDSNTSQMIFPVPELVAYVSQVATLEPGDLIFTGTGPGVGFARKPPVFLKPGDGCEVEIENIGILRNDCVAE